MPSHQIAGSSFDVSRRGVLVDTNVVVAAFSPGERFHERARFLLMEANERLYLPASVLAESWGMLAGSKGRRDHAVEMLAWLLEDMNVLLVPDEALVDAVTETVNRCHVDVVDSLVSLLAARISRSCSLRPPLRVATMDTGDYWRCRDAHDGDFDVWDIREAGL